MKSLLIVACTFMLFGFISPDVMAQDDNSANAKQPAAPAIRAYQNYDFVPGDKILFDDNFLTDQDGEFPVHWELKAGQAVINKMNGDPAFYLTDGNYVLVKPRMKTEKYLTDPFTVEFDMYGVPGSYGVIVQLLGHSKPGGDEFTSEVSVKQSEVNFNGTSGGVSLSKSLPDEINSSNDNFDNKWHHIAIISKTHQLKVYVDQFRVLNVPDTKEDYEAITFAGIGDEKSPIVFKNVRIASGGNMNMAGKKFTESKLVTHGINFEVDKATIKPESMGTLNMIVQILKDNPDIKFEIDGYTDNSGTPAHNLTLSQQRAGAVKDQLVKMGVDASRLTTKGLGDAKPIADNSTLEGKANNRRVEFVKV